MTLEPINHDNVCLFERKSGYIDWGFDFVDVEGFGRNFFFVSDGLKENFKRKRFERPAKFAVFHQMATLLKKSRKFYKGEQI